MINNCESVTTKKSLSTNKVCRTDNVIPICRYASQATKIISLPKQKLESRVTQVKVKSLPSLEAGSYTQFQ